MMMRSFTPFHLVDLSPWPLLTSVSLLSGLTGVAGYFGGFVLGGTVAGLGFMGLVLSSGLWFRDIVREGFQGNHTGAVGRGIRIGFLLFLVSEIFLFASFFWALLNNSLNPGVELGCSWPPKGVEAIDPWNLPFYNALVLLSSGFTVTWAHHSVVGGLWREGLLGLWITVALAFFFCVLMVKEYELAEFSIADSAFGSSFYILTGLHFGHMVVGGAFLAVAAVRLGRYHFTPSSHLALEFAILYYHLVDAIFLVVFGLVYWWSSGVAFHF